MIHCAKCKTVNPPDLRFCQKCRHDLLPGEGIATRIGYLIGAALLTALGIFLFLRLDPADIPDGLDCAFTSPLFWGIMVIAMPIFGIWSALRPTPHYKRYLARAQRHTSLDPNQALADLDQAMGLAPPKEQTVIFKTRASLYQKLGMQKEATRDKIESMQSESTDQGEESLGGIAGAFIDGAAKGTRDSAQQSLLNSGEAIAVGYCKKCKDAVELDSKLHCKTHPRVRAMEVRLSIPEDLEKTRVALLDSRHKQAQQLMRRRVVALAALVVVCVGLAYLTNQFGNESEPDTPPTLPVGMVITEEVDSQQGVNEETPEETEQLFDDGDFHFHYPADWQTIQGDDTDKLLNTSLKGIDTDQIEYLGGVYHDGLNNCPGCAQIVIVALTEPAMTGTLTEEQFEAVKQANQERMGDRLIEYNLTSVGTFPAAESKHIGASRESRLWELIIVPPTEGLVYLFSMSSAREDYATFEPQFQAALDTLEIGGGTEQAVQQKPTEAATPTQAAELIATVLKDSINLRAGPSTSYPVAGVLEKGQEILVHGKNETGDWLCTTLENGNEAWVFLPLVVLDGDVQDLPLEMLNE